MARRSALVIAAAVLTIAAGAASADDSNQSSPTQSVPMGGTEPTKCYRLFEAPGLTVGQAIDLCSGTTDARATLRCFYEAWGTTQEGGLGLTAGQAIRLCRTAGVPDRQ